MNLIGKKLIRMNPFNNPREIGSDFSLNLNIFRLKEKNDFMKHFNLKKNLFFLFNSGRSTLKFYLKEIYNKKKIFLLPSYLCHSVIQPFIELKIPFQFYKINKNLEIDISHLRNLISNSVGGALFIHYFGFPQNESILKFYRVLKNFEIDIVEDITHSILTNETEIYGDYSFSSLRKILPLPDGGLLKSNRENLNNIEFHQGYDEIWGKRLVGSLYKDKYLKGKLTDKNEFLSLFREAEMILDSREIEIFSMTKFSTFLLNKFNYSKIINIRRQNFKFILEKLTNSKRLIPLYKNLDKIVCPLGFPILVEKRESLKTKLIENNIFPPIHWALPELVNKVKFSQSWELSNQILTIPCDQRYTINDMQYIVDVINNWENGI